METATDSGYPLPTRYFGAGQNEHLPIVLTDTDLTRRRKAHVPEFPLVPDGSETGTTPARRERPLTRRELREQQRREQEAAEAAAYGFGTPLLDPSRSGANSGAPEIRSTGQGWSLGGDVDPVESAPAWQPEPQAERQPWQPEPQAERMPPEPAPAPEAPRYEAEVTPTPAPADQPLRRRRDARLPAADSETSAAASWSLDAPEAATLQPQEASEPDVSSWFAADTPEPVADERPTSRRARRAAETAVPAEPEPTELQLSVPERIVQEPGAPEPPASEHAVPESAAPEFALSDFPPSRVHDESHAQMQPGWDEPTEYEQPAELADAGASPFGDLVFDAPEVVESRETRGAGRGGFLSRLLGGSRERATPERRRAADRDHDAAVPTPDVYGADTRGTDDDLAADLFGFGFDEGERDDAELVEAPQPAPASESEPVFEPVHEAEPEPMPEPEPSPVLEVARDPEPAPVPEPAADLAGSLFGFDDPAEHGSTDASHVGSAASVSALGLVGGGANAWSLDDDGDATTGQPATAPRTHAPTRSAARAATASRSAAPARSSAGTHPKKKPTRDQRRAARRRAAAAKGFSVVAMGFVAMITVATSLPANSLLSAEEVAAAQVAIQHEAGLEPQVMHSYGGDGDSTEFTVDTENYQVATIAEYAAASGIRVDNTFTNNPYGTIQWPFPVGVHIGSYYGWRSCAGCTANHHGIDFNPGYGAEIQAIADGTVSVAQNGGGSLGVVMMIDHVIDGQVVTSVYAHMQYDSMRYRVGDTVKVGDIVGNVGSTGLSTGPHLHFEIRIGGVEGYWVDPLAWLYENTD